MRGPTLTFARWLAYSSVSIEKSDARSRVESSEFNPPLGLIRANDHAETGMTRTIAVTIGSAASVSGIAAVR